MSGFGMQRRRERSKKHPSAFISSSYSPGLNRLDPTNPTLEALLSNLSQSTQLVTTGQGGTESCYLDVHLQSHLKENLR